MESLASRFVFDRSAAWPIGRRLPALAAKLGVALALAASLVGCSKSNAAEAFDIVVCLIDAQRADRLSCYGGPRPTSPNIDALAKRGVLFERAYTPASWTLPAVASLFTGNMPSVHGAGVWQDDRGDGNPTPLAKPTTTLAERVRELGYHAYARATNPYVEFGCTQGFEEASTIPGSARDLVDWALEKGAADPAKPALFYLHFMDVHTARDLSPPDVDAFPTPEAGPRRREHLEFHTAVEQKLEGDALRNFATHRLATYDGALLATDRELGRLFRELPKIRNSRPRLWILVADHGEEFWEHKELQEKCYHYSRGYCGMGHGHTLFEEVLRIPMIFAAEGIAGSDKIASGIRLKTPVSLLDVPPTVLDLMGLGPKIATHTDGRSLRAALAGAEPPRIPLYAQQILYGHRRRSILDINDRKLIQVYDPRETPLLFDVAADPKERKDLRAEQTQQFAELDKKLKAYFETLDVLYTREEVEIDPALKADLQDIGYFGGRRKTPESQPNK
jgi:arylsulfatase A-like enzyme